MIPKNSVRYDMIWARHAVASRIGPENNRSSEAAPSYRVYVGRAEIGAAWSKRSDGGGHYLSLKLDDPSFNAPIYANLIVEDGAEN